MLMFIKNVSFSKQSFSLFQGFLIETPPVNGSAAVAQLTEVEEDLHFLKTSPFLYFFESLLK